ncbi:hypothetical protein ACQ4PT_020530 [Festuca glaucescens]
MAKLKPAAAAKLGGNGMGIIRGRVPGTGQAFRETTVPFPSPEEVREARTDGALPASWPEGRASSDPVNCAGAPNIETHLIDVAKPNATEPATEKQLVADTVASEADAADNIASEAPCVDVSKYTSPGSPDSKQAPNDECGQSPSTEFREAIKPRGSIDKNVMELFIRDFNLVTNIPTTSEPLSTKFAFSQSLTTKLIVHEDKFDPKTCLKEFQKVYKDHQLKSKYMLYFAIVDSEHWVLVCINLLLKQVNVLDSMIGGNKTRVYDRAHFLVNNFIKLASSANAFPKTNFGQFVQNNPQELRQQTTIFDCGVFVMMFMTQWDGKIMKPFNQDLIQLRTLISYKILTSSLNKVDPTWVLKKKSLSVQPGC